MIDLKQKLIDEIQKISNDEILSQLSELLIENDESIEVEFSEYQIKKIRESQLQLKNGESFKNDDVMNSLND